MFDVSVLSGGIISVKTKNHRDLSGSFMRPQEFYENPILSNQHSVTREQIYQWWKTVSEEDYEDFWGGFNIPGRIFIQWVSQVTDLNENETKLIECIRDKIELSDISYIVGYSGNLRVLEHELSHALFFTNIEYRAESMALLLEVSKRKRDDFSRILIEHGYSEEVLNDEMVAYLATGMMGQITWLKEEAKPFKKLFKKYRRAK
jgi:hypothetical protein